MASLVVFWKRSFDWNSKHVRSLGCCMFIARQMAKSAGQQCCSLSLRSAASHHCCWWMLLCAECARVLGAAGTSQRGPGEQRVGVQVTAVRRPSHLRQLKHQDSSAAASPLQPHYATIRRLPHRYKVSHGPSPSCTPGMSLCASVMSSIFLSLTTNICIRRVRNHCCYYYSWAISFECKSFDFRFEIKLPRCCRSKIYH